MMRNRFRPGEVVEAMQAFCCGGGLFPEGQHAVVDAHHGHDWDHFYLKAFGCVPTRFFRRSALQNAQPGELQAEGRASGQAAGALPPSTSRDQ